MLFSLLFTPEAKSSGILVDLEKVFKQQLEVSTSTAVESSSVLGERSECHFPPSLHTFHGAPVTGNGLGGNKCGVSLSQMDGPLLSGLTF